MSPGIRKLALTAHVISSVGWLGAVAAFLVLGIVGVTTTSAETIRAVYVAMDLIGMFIVVPMSLAALVTGLIQSLGTPWGLVRHYWVLTKLVLSVVATILLVLHQFTAVEDAARRASLDPTPSHLGGLGIQLVADAGGAVVVLLAATVLSIYKPWGKTGEGRSVGRTIVIGLLVMVVIGIIVRHLAGGGFHH